jgi:hypothetical protein
VVIISVMKYTTWSHRPFNITPFCDYHFEQLETEELEIEQERGEKKVCQVKVGPSIKRYTRVDCNTTSYQWHCKQICDPLLEFPGFRMSLRGRFRSFFLRSLTSVDTVSPLANRMLSRVVYSRLNMKLTDQQ